MPVVGGGGGNNVLRPPKPLLEPPKVGLVWLVHTSSTGITGCCQTKDRCGGRRGSKCLQEGCYGLFVPSSDFSTYVCCSLNLLHTLSGRLEREDSSMMWKADWGANKVLIFLRIWSVCVHALYILSAVDWEEFFGIPQKSPKSSADEMYRLDIFETPVSDPPTRNFLNFKFFQNSLNILNVYFWGKNVYFWGDNVYCWG